MADAGDDRVVDPLVRVATPLTRENPDRRAARSLRATCRRGHHLTEAAGDDHGPALGEQAADLLGPSLVLGAAPNH